VPPLASPPIAAPTVPAALDELPPAAPSDLEEPQAAFKSKRVRAEQTSLHPSVVFIFISRARCRLAAVDRDENGSIKDEQLCTKSKPGASRSRRTRRF
jgi:hypothetical protein